MEQDSYSPDGIFEKCGNPSAAMMRKLSVRGRSVKVGQALEKHFKWDTKEPIVSVINSVDPINGKILDTGYIVLGTWRMNFMATDLWVDAPKDVWVEIILDD